MNKYFMNQIQSRANYLGIKDATELAKKAGLDEERVKEIFNGAEPSISEFFKLTVALEYNLSQFASLAEKNHVPLVNEKYVGNIVVHGDAEKLVWLFVSGEIVEYDKELYCVGLRGRVNNKLSDDTVRKMFNVLMANGYVDTVSVHTTSKCNLGIKSIHDLDKYGDEIKNRYVYGVTDVVADNERVVVVNLPAYFKDFVKSLVEEERIDVMEEVERRLALRNESVKEFLQKGAKLEVVSGEVFLTVKNMTVALTKYDMSDIEGIGDMAERINEIQDDLFNSANK